MKGTIIRDHYHMSYASWNNEIHNERSSCLLLSSEIYWVTPSIWHTKFDATVSAYSSRGHTDFTWIIHFYTYIHIQEFPQISQFSAKSIDTNILAWALILCWVPDYMQSWALKIEDAQACYREKPRSLKSLQGKVSLPYSWAGNSTELIFFYKVNERVDASLLYSTLSRWSSPHGENNASLAYSGRVWNPDFRSLGSLMLMAHTNGRDSANSSSPCMLLFGGQTIPWTM